MTKDEALDLALEALEYIENNYMSLPKSGSEAITAIKQARALDKKAENARELGLDYEPVALKPTAQEVQNATANLALMREMWGDPNQPAAKVNAEGFIVETGLLLSPGTLLYTTPPAAPVQEPVAFNAGVPPLYPEMKDGETISVEYTTPPGGRQSEDCLTAAQEDIQRLSALVRAQQITIDKLEQARSAPVQEPVGEVVLESMGVRGSDAMRVRMHFYKEIPAVGSKIYTTPPAQPAPKCTRSHPHENMDAMCELRTEIARLTNENARLKAQPAPLQEPVKLRRGDVLRCIETDELCTVWATSTTHKTLVKWGGNDFSDYTAEQIGELFWLEPESSDVEIAAEQSDNYAAFHAGVRFARAHSFTTPKQEEVEIDWPDYHEQGMGCGLEDRGITDRYEAMRYGWDEALDKAVESVNLLGPLYTTPPAAPKKGN